MLKEAHFVLFTYAFPNPTYILMELLGAGALNKLCIMTSSTRASSV
jgi:hypothetical protein